jgi:hypothetical protein
MVDKRVLATEELVEWELNADSGRPKGMHHHKYSEQRQRQADRLRELREFLGDRRYTASIAQSHFVRERWLSDDEYLADRSLALFSAPGRRDG